MSLTHLGERLRSDVADRCSEPLEADRMDVLGTGPRRPPRARFGVGSNGYRVRSATPKLVLKRRHQMTTLS
jgi:hypothetical protein